MKSLEKRLFDDFFENRKKALPYADRSAAYRAGVMAALVHHSKGNKISNKYKAGTSRHDAFDSGVRDGHAIWYNNLRMNR